MPCLVLEGKSRLGAHVNRAPKGDQNFRQKRIERSRGSVTSPGLKGKPVSSTTEEMKGSDKKRLEKRERAQVLTESLVDSLVSGTRKKKVEGHGVGCRSTEEGTCYEEKR